ncbi:MAG TPA: hypothetical protein VMW72_01300 [Sedimentisphaerales bacterium]|nr:hypothetical protein [Sedimentisphaerales bacterium]
MTNRPRPCPILLSSTFSGSNQTGFSGTLTVEVEEEERRIVQRL